MFVLRNFSRGFKGYHEKFLCFVRPKDFCKCKGGGYHELFLTFGIIGNYGTIRSFNATNLTKLKIGSVKIGSIRNVALQKKMIETFSSFSTKRRIKIQIEINLKSKACDKVVRTKSQHFSPKIDFYFSLKFDLLRKLSSSRMGFPLEVWIFHENYTSRNIFKVNQLSAQQLSRITNSSYKLLTGFWILQWLSITSTERQRNFCFQEF